MKKNINVNINGFLYNIDEDAFEKLQNYLDRLKIHFKNQDGKEEIIKDIEDRISEMMHQITSGSKKVIEIADVNNIIKAMGEPYQIETNDDTTENTSDQNNANNYNPKKKRLLYIDFENRIVAGVASGLGAYFDIDPIFVRIAFILLVIFGGTGIIIYGLFWILVPFAKTTAQRLEMNGEAINIDNIEKKIKEEFESLSEKVHQFKKKNKDGLNIFERILEVLHSVFKIFIKTIAIFVGIIFIIVALTIIIALIPSFLQTDGFFIVGNSNFLFFSLQNFIELIFKTKSDQYLIITALAMVIGIPLIGLIFKGIKLIFGIRNRNYFVGTTFVIIWITGLLLLIISAFKISENFKLNGTDQTLISGENMKIGQNLYLTFDNMPNLNFEPNITDEENIFVNANFVYLIDSTRFYGLPKFTITHNDSNFSILVKKEAKGRTFRQAKNSAEAIELSYKFQDSIFSFTPLFSSLKSNKWRAQQMEVLINIPNGKNIKILNDTILNNELQSYLVSKNDLSFYFYPDGKHFTIQKGFKNQIISN